MDGTDGDDGQRKTLTWAARLARRTVLLVVLVTLGWVGFRVYVAGPVGRADADAALEALSAMGTPVDAEAFNSKYPATPAGERAVAQAAAAMILFDPALAVISREQDDSGDGDTPLPVGGFDLGRANGAGLDAGNISLPRLRRLVEESTLPLELIAALPQVCGHGEIGWALDFAHVPPMPHDTRTPGERQTRAGASLSSMREMSRVLMPSAIYMALADGDTTRAWRLAEGWAFLARAWRTQSTDRTQILLGAGLDTVFTRAAAELLGAAPPDRDTALRMAAAADPALLEQDYLRAWEAATIIRLRQVDSIIDPANAIHPAYVHNEFMATTRWAGSRRHWVSRWQPLIGPELQEIRRLLADKMMLMREGLLARSEAEYRELEARAARVELSEDATAVARALRQMPYAENVRVTLHQREALAQASILRAALLMRAREIDTGGAPAQLPKSLDDLRAAYGVAPLLDYLGDTPDARLIYTADSATGKFSITHAPSIEPKYAGDTPYVYEGRWGGAAMKTFEP